MNRILWIDDEIELLKPHILLLEKRGYSVTPLACGEDTMPLLREEKFDLILLDEIMPGKDGLAILKEIRESGIDSPVVIVTKSEDEKLIDKAYERAAHDFLIKPIKFPQLLSTVKRILEREKMLKSAIPQEYTAFYNRVQTTIMQKTDWKDWISIYSELTKWDITLEEEDLKDLNRELISTCEREFSRFIEDEYSFWLKGEEAPILSPDVVKLFLVPQAMEKERVYFVVLDCLKLDQWFSIKSLLNEFYEIEEHYYYSILPSATPYSRNSIYSGLFPSEIASRYPNYWDPEANKFEYELLVNQLRSMKIDRDITHIRVMNLQDAELLKKRVVGLKGIISIVINFLDFVVHLRKEAEVIHEVAPDEEGLRSLTQLWFSKSYLFELLKELSRDNISIILTTDHGSIFAKKPTVIHGGKSLSRNLRYKYGPALRCDTRHAIFINEPSQYKLPGKGIRYGIAKENYYFIYPTHPHEYEREYKYTFQHGGVSMQEMILPCAILSTR